MRPNSEWRAPYFLELSHSPMLINKILSLHNSSSDMQIIQYSSKMIESLLKKKKPFSQSKPLFSHPEVRRNDAILIFLFNAIMSF